MPVLDHILSKIKYKSNKPELLGDSYEFCPKCEANLTLQKGYSNDLSYWICKGCGEMLINPSLEEGITWICDGCGEMLNIQEGFSEDCGSWECLKCGYSNKIDKSEIYLSEDEFQEAYKSPYRGLSDEAMLALSLYSEEKLIKNRDDIILVRSMVDDKLYVKKILNTYDISVYAYLMENPVPYMPNIYEMYEGDNSLIVIEEYIEGKTLHEIISESTIALEKAVSISKSVCSIVKTLHGLDKPIIHRDIKPSNVLIGRKEEVYLLDINVAKWYKENEAEDTKLLGTQYYAAPEQLGYGFSASSEKSDIYAIGMLTNVMITGKFPKEEKAPEPIWHIIDRCIKLEPDERYSDQELIDELDKVLR